VVRTSHELAAASRRRSLEELRANPYLADFRKWVSATAATDLREAQDINRDVERVLQTTLHELIVIVLRARGAEWHETTDGSTALWALAGVSFFLVREVLPLGREAENHWRGGDEERAVGELLNTLREDGFVVSHDLPREGGGNVDHLVVTPFRRAFAIETKSGRSNAAGRAQAISNAVWAKGKLGRYTTAILCVGTDPPPSPAKNGYAWVLGRDHLLAFLRNPPPINSAVWRPPPRA
jgi:hypothetical protein